MKYSEYTGSTRKNDCLGEANYHTNRRFFGTPGTHTQHAKLLNFVVKQRSLSNQGKDILMGGCVQIFILQKYLHLQANQ